MAALLFLIWINGGVLVGHATTLRVDGQLDYDAIVGATDVLVLRSPGGSGASAMALSKVHRLVIKGRCASACAWGVLWNSHACMVPGAYLVLHGASDPGTGRPMPVVTRMWVMTLPAELQWAAGRIEAGELVPVAYHRLCKR